MQSIESKQLFSCGKLVDATLRLFKSFISSLRWMRYKASPESHVVRFEEASSYHPLASSIHKLCLLRLTEHQICCINYTKLQVLPLPGLSRAADPHAYKFMVEIVVTNNSRATSAALLKHFVMGLPRLQADGSSAPLASPGRAECKLQTDVLDGS